MPPSRSPAVDRVKALAILTVVLIHAGPERWQPAHTIIDTWLRLAWTGWAVPAFVMMSGTLYRAPSVTFATVGRRLQRLLVPYLFCCAALYGFQLVPWPGWRAALAAVAIGDTYGIFYFVFVLASCIGFSWCVAKLSPRAQWGALCLLLVVAVRMNLTPSLMSSDWTWRLRDPLSQCWFGLFLCGWLRVPQWCARHVPWPLLLIPALGMLPGSASSSFPTVLLWRVPYAIGVVACLWRLPPVVRERRTVAFLSEISLALYLWHLPFIFAVRPWLIAHPPLARIPATMAAGLGGGRERGPVGAMDPRPRPRAAICRGLTAAAAPR